MKKFFATLMLAALTWGAMAQQNDPVVFEINGEKIHQSEFKKEFLQSIGQDPAAAPTACTYEKRKALEEYADLFVNFRAKLADAYAQGYDTMASLNKELANYRNELAAPYLIDSATLMTLLREAYDRNHYALHAAHILVHCTPEAKPADTLAAYNHAMELYNKAVSGMDFYLVAQEEMRTQRAANIDPENREYKENPFEGDLGFFTVFDMIYAFENAAYKMQPGEIIKPVRTRYGYHVVKLFDRVEYYGKATVAHIWIRDDINANEAKRQIDEVYDMLNSGKDFGTMAKRYSSDRASANKDGLLPELAVNQIPIDYVKVIAQGLKVGEYSKPFHSPFGWHIIKLVTQETMPDFESMIPYYKQRMTKGERATKSKDVFVEQAKTRHQLLDFTTIKGTFTQNSDGSWLLTAPTKKNMKKATFASDLKEITSLVPDSIFSNIWHYDSTKVTDLRPLFKIGDKQYNARDLGKWMKKHKGVERIIPLDVYVQKKYNEFINDMVYRYADEHLEADNPDFAQLIDEYRHGLMIFAYNDRNIWSKAILDTVGFEAYYDKTSRQHDINDTNQAIYFWNTRARVQIISIADSSCLAPEKAYKIVEKTLKKKGYTTLMLRENLSKKINQKKCVAEEPIIITYEMPEVGRQSLLNANEWKNGLYIHPSGKGYQILNVEQMFEPCLKSAKEARGYYLNDYQNYLEAELNKELRQKYQVKINQEALDAITY